MSLKQSENGLKKWSPKRNRNFLHLQLSIN